MNNGSDPSSDAPPPLLPPPERVDGLVGVDDWVIEAAVTRPRVWTVFITLIATIVAMNGLVVMLVIAMSGASLVAGADPHDIPSLLETPEYFFGMLLLTSVATVVVTLSASKLSPVPMMNRLHLGPSTLRWRDLAVMLLGALAVSVLVSTLLQLMDWTDPGAMGAFNTSILSLSPSGMIGAVLLISLGAGIGEELLFRGYLQSRLSQRWGPIAGILVTTLLFAAFHMDLMQSVGVLGIGAYLGYVAFRSGSVRPAMACHIFNNAFATAVIIAYNDPELFEKSYLKPSDAAWFIIALVVLALCLRHIHTHVRSADAATPADMPSGDGAGPA